jgi:hypothetical protein
MLGAEFFFTHSRKSYHTIVNTSVNLAGRFVKGEGLTEPGIPL